MTYISPLSFTSPYSNTSITKDSDTKVVQQNNINTTKIENVLISGESMIQHLGRSVLGEENITQWKKYGLEIDNKTIEYAFEQMNKALNDLGGKAGKASFNHYQIIKNMQTVPNLFNEEHLQWLNGIQDPIVKERFQAEELYTTQSSAQYEPVNSYTLISRLSN